VRSRLTSGRQHGGDNPISQVPVRTCVGCRRRAAATDLLRVVAGPLQQSGTASGPVRQLEPDPRRRKAGRGAWVHPDPGCVALAERRRAFGRALRCQVRLDPAALVRYVATVTAET